jgi:3-oxoadipate enol-lactonase
VSELRVMSPDGVVLAARAAGPEAGSPIVLMHGLTMTRDELAAAGAELARAGFRVVSYDARGHGSSGAPSDPRAYDYDALTADALAVMDAFELTRAVLVGASMGAHTALRIALTEPSRVAGLAIVSPGYDPDAHPGSGLREWSRLALVLRLAGPDAFSAALPLGNVAPERAKIVRELTRRRMGQHHALTATADALEAVPLDAPFGTLDELGAIDVPTLVVASRDQFDQVHPFALAERYAAAIQGSGFACEPAGGLPLAWSGGELAREVRRLAEAAYAPVVAATGGRAA